MEIRFPRPDGKEATGHLSMPTDGEKTPGIVLVHEWWGLNDQTKNFSRRLAEMGYRVLVPDLYEGEVAKIGDVDKAGKLMSSLERDDAVQQTIAGAVQYLKERSDGHRVAVLGLCMGGALAIKAAVEVRDLDAAVAFYAVSPTQVADVRQIRIPFQAHVSTIDEFVPPEENDAFARNLETGGVTHEFHRYDAAHAFMNEQRPDKYDAHAAKVAWDRTLRFLESSIGGHSAAGVSKPGTAPIP